SQSLTGKVLTSFKRDRQLPLGHMILKGVRYGTAVATAPLYLRACDRVGARARTRGGKPVIENLGRIVLGDDVQINSTFAKVRLATGPHGALTIGDAVDLNLGVTTSPEEPVPLGSPASLRHH